MNGEWILLGANAEMLEVGSESNRLTINVQFNAGLAGQIIRPLERVVVMREQIEIHRIAVLQIKRAQRGAAG